MSQSMSISYRIPGICWQWHPPGFLGLPERIWCRLLLCLRVSVIWRWIGRSPFFSGDRAQQVHLTKQVKCEGQFQCLSASAKENLHQPMPQLYLAVPTLRFSTALELKLFLLRHLQKAMNIFSSQDRRLKLELFEMQNQSKSFTHHPLCRDV